MKSSPAGLRFRIRRLDALAQILDIGVEPGKAFVRVAPIDIAQRDNILAGKIDDVGAAHSADTNSGDIQQIAGRSRSAAEHVPRHDRQSGTNHCRVSYKLPPYDRFRLHWILQI